MPDFRDSFTAREVCEGMLSQINVARLRPAQIDHGKGATTGRYTRKKMLHAFGASSGQTAEVTPIQSRRRSFNN